MYSKILENSPCGWAIQLSDTECCEYKDLREFKKWLKKVMEKKKIVGDKKGQTCSNPTSPLTIFFHLGDGLGEVLLCGFAFSSNMDHWTQPDTYQ